MDTVRRFRGAPLLLALLAVLAPLRAGALAAPRLSCGTGTWSVVPSPNPYGYSSLSGVAAASATDAWAVGGGIAGLRDQVVIAHWDGTSWQDASPALGGYLFGVAALSATDAWAVGRTDGNRTLTLHWDGTRWAVVPSPNQVAAASVLQGVAAVSPSDVWAVGYAGTVSLPQQTLIEHWDGTAWHLVRSPNGGSSTNSLSGVTAVSRTDVWAVGYDVDVSTGHNALLTEHWDGARWAVVPAAATGNDLTFTSVTSTDARHVWAAGYRTNQGGSLVERWTGLQWTNVITDSPHVFLYGVAAFGPSSVWTVGGGATTVTIHWDGSAWTIVPSPNGQDDYSQLNGVAMPSAQSAWAVGYTYSTAPQQSATLIEAYC
jgi:hypothetical protein